MIQLLQTPESRTHPDACVPTQVQQPWEGRVEAEEKRQESRDVKRLSAEVLEVWHIFRSRDRTSWVIDSLAWDSAPQLPQPVPSGRVSHLLPELHGADRDDAVAARLTTDVEAP